MTTSPAALRHLLLEAIDLLDSVQDQLVSVDRMHVERLKEMSGWERQTIASGADFKGEVPALMSALVRGANLQAAE